MRGQIFVLEQSYCFSSPIPLCISYCHTGSLRVTRPTLAWSTRIGLTELEQSVQHFLEAGLADSFKRVCNPGWHRYLAFCQKVILLSIPITQEKANLVCGISGSRGLGQL